MLDELRYSKTELAHHEGSCRASGVSNYKSNFGRVLVPRRYNTSAGQVGAQEATANAAA